MKSLIDTVFSKEAFLSSDSGRRLKSQIGCHLDVVDGLPVKIDENGIGSIQYEVNGERWELYPVMPEWCEIQSQITLFGGL